MKTGYLIVDEMSHLTLSGNVIPNAWYQKIILPNGKAHLTAILILSDIVYWYRPTIERCPETGKVIGRKKKFRKDMLQASYQSYADKFNISKWKVKEAIDFLVDNKLIKREFRSYRTQSGVYVNNAVFVEPIPEAIKKISIEESKRVSIDTTEKSIPTTVKNQSTTPKELQEIPPKNGGTNTNITYKNSYKTSTTLFHHQVEVEEIKPLIHFFESNGFGVVCPYLTSKMITWCNELSRQHVLNQL